VGGWGELYANLIWAVTKNLEVGGELSYWTTSYLPPLQNNNGLVYEMRVQLSF
jgi:hypothetical protein